MSVIEEFLAGAVLTLLVCAACIIGYEMVTVSDLRAELQTSNDNTASCAAVNKSLQVSVDAQNAAVKKINTDAAQRSVVAAKAVAAAQTSSKKVDAKAASILSQKVSADDCSGAKQVLTSYLKGRHP